MQQKIVGIKRAIKIVPMIISEILAQFFPVHNPMPMKIRKTPKNHGTNPSKIGKTEIKIETSELLSKAEYTII